MRKLIVFILFVALMAMGGCVVAGFSLLGGVTGTTAAAQQNCLPGAQPEGSETNPKLDVQPYRGVSLDTDGVTIKNKPLHEWKRAEHRAEMIVMIVAIGMARGISERGRQIALATATQESEIENKPGGDRDSGGLFQQRPSIGGSNPYWGTYEQVTTPKYAINRFYQELETIDNWEDRELWDVAQDIQGSAFPTAYAQWEDEAANTLKHIKVGKLGSGSENDASLSEDTTLDGGVTGDAGLSDVSCQEPGATEPTAAALDRAIAHALAKSKEPGVRYVLGATGPKAYDCSSFLQWAFGKAGIKLPRTSREQWMYEPADRVSPKDPLKRGDLVFWAKGGDVSEKKNDVYHVGLYLGEVQGYEEPQLLDAANPRRGIGMHDMYFGDDYVGAIRLTLANDLDEPSGGWVSPLAAGTFSFTDSYGPRTHPVYGTPDFHNGPDLGAPSGMPIKAVAFGTVVRSGYMGAWGNAVLLKHGDGLFSFYAHMSRIAPGKATLPGSIIPKGETIGYVGSTGASTGSHLHFTLGTSEELLKGEQAGSIDAYKFLKARGIDLKELAGS